MEKIKVTLLIMLVIVGGLKAQDRSKYVMIETNVGSMKAKLYEDVPNHVNQFIKRATTGEFNGTLFTRVIKEFMIQGGAPDSKTAPEGARCGYGDKSAQIAPEMREHYFHKKGALASPRQPDDINPKKKSDISQFFIVQGKVYRDGELDTLELIKNIPIRKKAMDMYYKPIKVEVEMLKRSNAKEYNKRVAVINALVDSVVRSTPGHLLFTLEQRKAYTTIGGCHHLDGIYTIFGEVVDGLEIIDLIAQQPKDQYDRPKKDIRIKRIYLLN